MQKVSAMRLSLGRTGNLPGGMGKLVGLLNPALICRDERRPRSVRQVAGRHRQVACATHCYRTSPTFNRTRKARLMNPGIDVLRRIPKMTRKFLTNYANEFFRKRQHQLNASGGAPFPATSGIFQDGSYQIAGAVQKALSRID